MNSLRLTSLVSLVSAVLVVLPIQSSAQKKELWVASGASGGTYRDVYARNLATFMAGYEFRTRKSSGSGENLDMLSDGRAELGFAQADVYAEKLRTDPERYKKLVLIGRLADECVYIAHRVEGPVREFSQFSTPIGGRAPKLVVGGTEGTGMSGTWDYLVALQPKLSETAAHHVEGTLGLNQLAVGAFDAVGWVTDPGNSDHKLLRAVMANKALGLMDIVDPAFSNQLPDGTRIYTPRTIKLSQKWRSDKLQTICTSAMVFASDSASEKLVSRVSDLIILKRNRIVPSTPSPW